MKNAVKTVLFLMLLSFFGSCQRNTTESLGDEIYVRIEDNGLVLENRTSEGIGFLAAEKEVVNLLDWVPSCRDENRISSSREKEVSYSEIIGYYKNCEVVIFWWYCDGELPRGEIKQGTALAR